MKSREQRAVWSDLRSTRYAPPGAATSGSERRDTYVAALQQAEELFDAAGTVGVASAPLPIFYGLSQAGRAIAAAARALGEQDWHLSGHGIKAQRLDGKLADVHVFTTRNEAGSAFVRLSNLLGSPLWTGANAPRFAQLWNGIPDLASHPLADSGPHRPPLLAEPNSAHEGHPLVTAWVSGLPGRLAAPETGADDFTGFMAGYPTAAGYSYVHDGKGRPQYAPDPDGTGVGVQMHWSAGERFPVAEEIRVATINRAVRPYVADRFYLFPEIIAGEPPLHPLMAWWAVLYALSMLARYQPAAWAAAIDVNSSEHATALEHLLSEALTTVPGLVLAVLQAVS